VLFVDDKGDVDPKRSSGGSINDVCTNCPPSTYAFKRRRAHERGEIPHVAFFDGHAVINVAKVKEKVRQGGLGTD
jgi:prepilin-type processing-associated H-X9-DG protein